MENLKIENAEIRFRNFAGKERDYNPEGQRNFCVFFDLEKAHELEKIGWNVKYTKPSDTYEQKGYIPVAVSFDHIPPTVYMITSKKAVKLGPETIGILDWSELQNVDLDISPYMWNVSGRKGVKAYLKTMYAVIKEDEFAEKYNAQLIASVQESSDDDLPF